MILIKYIICLSLLMLTSQKGFELFKEIQCQQRNRLVTTQLMTQLLALKKEKEWVYSTGYCRSFFQGRKIDKEIKIYKNFRSYQNLPLK